MNDYLAQVRRDRQWPALFSLAGVYPGDWTPVDSLVIQGDLTQELDFTTTPLDYALLERSLGPARTMAWFPVLPPNQQHPYDPGPYRQACRSRCSPELSHNLPQRKPPAVPRTSRTPPRDRHRLRHGARPQAAARAAIVPPAHRPGRGRPRRPRCWPP